jgi:acyl homoserine lactone synthase
MLSMQNAVPSRSKGRERADGLAVPGVFAREGRFIVKNLLSDEEKVEAYRLRHRVFAEELKWVPRSETLLEIDEYDNNASFFGVYDDSNRLVAFLRMILPEKRFMMEKEFSFLVGPDHEIRKSDDTAEVSRLCTLPEARNRRGDDNFGVFGITMLLYKGLYLWSLRNGIRYLYLVVDRTVYRMFRLKGFPCEPVGEPVRMADGCVAVAAMLDLRRGESENRLNRPDMMQWFSQY